MCYEADAIPPFYGPALTTTTSAGLLLTASDGASCAAYLSLPAEPSGPGVLVLPDNRGLSRFYEELTRRLAEQGLPALAVDYFGRSAGTDYRARPADFGALPRHMTHLRALTREALSADFDAALAHLRSPAGGACRAVISLGFCMGGRFAFTAAHRRFALAGAIGLYGFPDALNGAPGPIQLARELTAPILGLFAGQDEGIPASMVAAFDEALAAAGNAHEIVTYPGTTHGFFEADALAFQEECADVWRRVLDFAHRHRDAEA
ncbi:dienelactone hydrolase family protein [Actinocrinis puniceicyclus]|uniref:Dienelactone hydrolase family protein n=1 Tax=Actinocrinis puniceicyclus TaxID=977794 RepID=A0A8J8BC51_9ACTN|nr:dienelactone hydrolase family protein [Actinocrinis puniceicyclus]MBS2963773.1 dienelactone hydrolase family protein [Actinocrinis puniceicyclus]